MASASYSFFNRQFISGCINFRERNAFLMPGSFQVANYVQQEPYSPIDIQNAKESLIKFLQRNGYFRAEVKPEVQVDKTNGLANVNFRVELNRPAKFGDVIIQGKMAEETEHLKGSLHSLALA